MGNCGLCASVIEGTYNSVLLECGVYPRPAVAYLMYLGWCIVVCKVDIEPSLGVVEVHHPLRQQHEVERGLRISNNAETAPVRNKHIVPSQVCLVHLEPVGA